jgi:hypothetical protein
MTKKMKGRTADSKVGKRQSRKKNGPNRGKRKTTARDVRASENDKDSTFRLELLVSFTLACRPPMFDSDAAPPNSALPKEAL